MMTKVVGIDESEGEPEAAPPVRRATCLKDRQAALLPCVGPNLGARCFGYFVRAVPIAARDGWRSSWD